MIKILQLSSRVAVDSDLDNELMTIAGHIMPRPDHPLTSIKAAAFLQHGGVMGSPVRAECMVDHVCDDLWMEDLPWHAVEEW